MMNQEQDPKKRVSFRFDRELLRLLETAQSSDVELYRDRSRTWLVEYAVRQQFKELAEANGSS